MVVGRGIAKTFILSSYAHYDTASQFPYCISYSVFSTDDIYTCIYTVESHVAGDNC